jgi:hypothetical protein
MHEEDVIRYDPSIDRDPHAEEVDTELMEELLSLTPAQRIMRHERLLESVRELRKAGIKLYGFDPRIPETDE